MALALALPGSAAAAVCKYDPPPKLTRQERELRNAISARRLWGLPRSRTFVRRVNEDPAARRRGFELLDFPMTKKEAWYFRLRQRFQDERYTRRLDAYLRRQQASFGGVSIEDDYPRGPYMLVHFTRDLTRHRRAISRRFAQRFVIRRVPYSERELRRVQYAIDREVLDREGINFLGSSLEPGYVRLEVTTARPDVLDVVRGLYGPAVSVDVVAATPTYFACASPKSYTVGEDGRTMQVTYVDSGSVRPRYVEVVESATEVRVGVVSEVPHGFVTADAVTYTLSVTLSEPLGHRVVRSIRSGRSVPLQNSK